MGKKIPLGVKDPADEAGALAAYAKLIGEAGVRPSAPSVQSGTVADAVEKFRAAGLRRLRRGEVKRKALDDYEYALRPFLAAFGTRAMSDLVSEEGREEVLDWACKPGWSSSTRNSYLGVILSLFKGAGLRLKVQRPPKRSRGASSVVTDAQFEAALSVAVKGKYPGDLRELLRCLRECGARPGEVARLTVAMVDWPNCCTRLVEHKTDAGGMDRVIHFPASAMAVLSKQRERYGAGLLFRTRAGGRYRAGAIVRRCGVISKRCGFRFIAYGQRHSFATSALENGVPDTLVAGLLGHVGTGMLHRHYSHLGEQARALKDAAERARAG
jgi:integrase